MSACKWKVGDFSGNRSEKDALSEKKDSNTWETIVILEIFNFAM